MAKQHTKGGQTADLEVNCPFAIAANDDNEIESVGAKIHCNQTGLYNLVLEGSDTPRSFHLIAGITYPFRIRKVMATGTENANGLIGLTSVHSEGAN